MKGRDNTMKILIVSGLSGGGKSKAASFLEDMGYYIVDNMPAEMILKFADFCASGSNRYDRVALVYDIRAGEGFELLLDVMQQLKKRVSCHLLYMKADPDVIIRRYKETRRTHPLLAQAGSIEAAVHMEQTMLTRVEQSADYVLDTTTFSIPKLKSELQHLFGGNEKGEDFVVELISFGYKHGLPLEADLVFDVRFLPNPYYIDHMRHLTGMDAIVYDYVMGFPQTREYLAKVNDLLRFSLPQYRDEGKSMLVIAVGCTGGHHRSIAVARALAASIREMGYQVHENHRDQGRN